MSRRNFAAFGVDPRARSGRETAGTGGTPPVHPPYTPRAYEIPDFAAFGVDPRSGLTKQTQEAKR